jgi:hypothetical protein
MEKEIEALFEQIVNEELDKNGLSGLPEHVGDTE